MSGHVRRDSLYICCLSPCESRRFTNSADHSSIVLLTLPRRCHTSKGSQCNTIWHPFRRAKCVWSATQLACDRVGCLCDVDGCVCDVDGCVCVCVCDVCACVMCVCVCVCVCVYVCVCVCEQTDYTITIYSGKLNGVRVTKCM